MKQLPANSGLFSVCCTDIVTKLAADRLLFRLYYPTAVTVEPDNSKLASWLESPEYAGGYTNFLKLKIMKPVFNWFFSGVHSNAVWNGEFKLPTQIKKLPVVVFSHGLGANKTTYSSICSDLASYGMLVAAVEHADESACATYYLDETESAENPVLQRKWIDYLHVKSGAADEHSIRNKQVHFRGDECCQVLDEIAKINDGKANYVKCDIDLSPFKNVVDLSKCAVMGHSFGGATAISAISKDDRFKVGVGLDTWMYPLDKTIYQKIKPIPFLFINTENFQWPENIANMRKLDADVYEINVERLMVTLTGTVHFSQTDFPLLIDSRFLQKLFNVVGTTDPQDVFEVNRKLAFGFVGKHLDLDCGRSVDDVIKENAHLVYAGSNVKVDEEKVKQSKLNLVSNL